MNKYKLSSLIRKFGLIKLSDKLRFYIGYIKSSGLRKEFKRKHPTVKLPPAYFMYETFNLNYFSFYEKSIETAKWLISHFEKHKKLEGINILDWGCGPGRVIRHLPSFIADTCKCYGTDYNKKYTKWCSINIPEVTFSTNNLEPPLNYEPEMFDIIYGISIFTHLSEEMHYAWMKELFRVLKPGGIILLSMQGEVFAQKLSDTEKQLFSEGKLIVKGNTKEGHRTYSAFQPKEFMVKLVAKNTVLEHIPGTIKNGKPEQDVWIIQKSNN